jgi:hypothetical protein
MQADAFVEALKQAIRESLGHPAWYKNVRATYDRFCESHPDVEEIMPGKVIDNGNGALLCGLWTAMASPLRFIRY